MFLCEKFGWPSFVTSEITSLCLNIVMSSSFFMDLIHSPAVWFFDTWHEIDNFCHFWTEVTIAHWCWHLINLLPGLCLLHWSVGQQILFEVYKVYITFGLKLQIRNSFELILWIVASFDLALWNSVWYVRLIWYAWIFPKCEVNGWFLLITLRLWQNTEVKAFISV